MSPSPRSWGRHTRLVAALAVPVLLFELQLALTWGETNNGNDLNAVLVVTIAAAAAVGTAALFARSFDERHPGSAWSSVVTRLLAPVLVLANVSAWVQNRGLFADSDTAWLGTAVLSALMVGGAVLLTRPGTFAIHRPAPAPPVEPRPAAVFPATPPTGPPPVPTAPESPPPPPAPVPAPPSDRGWTHRLTSWSITAGWLPLGAVFLFVANYCPDDGEGAWVFALSLGFVAVQLGGNLLAGYALDRHFGRRGGAALAVGRSVLTAIVLILASSVVWRIIASFGPDGPSRYCG